MNFKILCIVCAISMAINHASTLTVNERIHNGHEAIDDERYAVRIISSIDEITQRGFLSSGVAVTSHHVVTVAQAIAGFAVWRIGYGSIRVDEQVVVLSNSAVHHPLFSPLLLHNNVGVIRVPRDLPYWNYLPVSFEPYPTPRWALGYGYTNNSLVLPNILQAASVFPRPLENCADHFEGDVVRADNLCVASSAQFTNGDQGGAVTFHWLDRIVAIISFWGLTESSPSVLVNLSEHREFLETQFAV